MKADDKRQNGKKNTVVADIVFDLSGKGQNTAFDDFKIKHKIEVSGTQIVYYDEPKFGGKKRVYNVVLIKFH